MFKLSKLYTILSILAFSKEKFQNESQNFTKFKTMSYNVRCFSDVLRYNLDGSINTRLPRIIKNIFKYLPDTIGFQEVTTDNWYPKIKEALSPYYINVGVGREKDLSGEANPIFINNETLELIDFGTKWLSQTPDIPGSKFPDTSLHPTDGLPRILTFAIVKNKISNVTYMHINTHLDWMSSANRISQVKVIKKYINQYKKKYAIILTGDFNSGNIENKNDAIPYLLGKGYILSSNEANETDNHWTFSEVGYYNEIWEKCENRGFHKNNKSLTEQKECDEECDCENGEIFDYCLKPNTSSVIFTKYKVISDFSDLGGPSSDHYPIYIEGIVFNKVGNDDEENDYDDDDEEYFVNDIYVLISIFIGLCLIVLVVILVVIIIFVKIRKKKDININEIKDNENKIENENLLDNSE